MRQRKKPMRVCLGCGQVKEKSHLLRVVLSPDGQIHIDPTGNAPGRGAYVEASKDCLLVAYEDHKLERSLKHAVSEDVYKQLLEELANESGQDS